MKKGQELVKEFSGLTIIYQKIPQYELGLHQHEDHEFFLPLQGHIMVKYAAEELRVGRQHICYIPPDLTHSFSSVQVGSGERLILLLSRSLWNEYGCELAGPTVTLLSGLTKELIFYLLVHAKLKNEKVFTIALIESLAESFRSKHIEEQKLAFVNGTRGVSDSRIKKAIKMMREESGVLKLSEVPKKSGLSTRNFNRLFLKETGLTPRDFVLFLRVEKAKQLLKETQMAITDISLEVGYNSLSKFIATFKKVTGVLPSDYRFYQTDN